MAKRDLLSIDDLTRADVELILDTAESFLPVLQRDIKKVPTLRGRTIINMFYESSTRTLTSFDLAAKRLSADTMNVRASGSAVDKGESLKDTILTLSAYSARHHRHAPSPDRRLPAGRAVHAGQRHQRRRRQAPAPLAVPARPVHAAPGAGPRPQRHEGVASSATSCTAAWRAATSRASGCSAWTSRSSRRRRSCRATSNRWGSRSSTRSIDLHEADVVYLLRIQMERMQEGANFLPSLREYATLCGITLERLRPGQKVMHPGPINRGVEISAAVADDPTRSSSSRSRAAWPCAWPSSTARSSATTSARRREGCG